MDLCWQTPFRRFAPPSPFSGGTATNACSLAADICVEAVVPPEKGVPAVLRAGVCWGTATNALFFFSLAEDVVDDEQGGDEDFFEGRFSSEEGGEVFE